ncbi:MAG: hypothetical protein MI784_06965 [Cytophagales bacterium]|nr:hypothetical protein [Cytophagales bacterium]
MDKLILFVGVGRIYQQTGIDTYSKTVSAKLYDRKNALAVKKSAKSVVRNSQLSDQEVTTAIYGKKGQAFNLKH